MQREKEDAVELLKTIELVVPELKLMLEKGLEKMDEKTNQEKVRFSKIAAL